MNYLARMEEELLRPAPQPSESLSISLNDYNELPIETLESCSKARLSLEESQYLSRLVQVVFTITCLGVI